MTTTDEPGKVSARTLDYPSVDGWFAYHAHRETRDAGLWARPANLWPMDAGTATELDARLAVLRPRTIVEVGSGSSTLVLARYAAATGAKVYTLEHSERYAAQTLRLLEAHGLEERVEIHLRPLVSYDVGGMTLGPWYAHDDIPSMVDFVVVDGPPQGAGGRAAVLPALWSRLQRSGTGWELWLDDAHRPLELDAVKTWLGMFPQLQMHAAPFGKNGVAIIRPDGSLAQRFEWVDASDVCVTILTGRRPDKLGELIESLRLNAPGLLDTAQVIAMHNGANDHHATKETAAILATLPGAVLETTELYGIGRAVTMLERAARDSGQTWWLHLEDDWRVATVAHTWLRDARAVLENNPRVTQVRLRHWSELVLSRHMVRGTPITWSKLGAAPALEADAHLTFNPFLAFNGALSGLFPVESERDLMAKAVRQLSPDMRVAQLYPGAFAHTGGSDSLRRREGSE